MHTILLKGWVPWQDTCSAWFLPALFHNGCHLSFAFPWGTSMVIFLLPLSIAYLVKGQVKTNCALPLWESQFFLQYSRLHPIPFPSSGAHEQFAQGHTDWLYWQGGAVGSGTFNHLLCSQITKPLSFPASIPLHYIEHVAIQRKRFLF